MSFRADNRAFEKWLRTQCSVVDADLDYKHDRMKKNAFVFLRATFFRWAKRIETLCPELKDAPPCCPSATRTRRTLVLGATQKDASLGHQRF
jgi:hypothetical protein